MQLKGVFNVQFAIQENIIYVLEMNPRASRTLPFLCKATGLPLVQIATYCTLGKTLKDQGIALNSELPFFCVKEAVLPFIKFSKSLAVLGPEMKSTGEVMGIGKSPEEAYGKAQIAAGNKLPNPGNVCLIASDRITQSLTVPLARLGFRVKTKFSDTAENFVLVIAINDIYTSNREILSATRFAVDNGICYATTLETAYALIAAIENHLKNNYEVCSLQNLYEKDFIPSTKHLLTGEELTVEQLNKILDKALDLKCERSKGLLRSELDKLNLALLFDKPSLRTRFSFAVAMRELGGDVIESTENTRKTEIPEDQARVLSGYCHAIMIRTYEHSTIERMSQAAKIPIINGLSNLHHPCQVLADLLTLRERFSSLQNLTLSYIGDGNNVLHSLLLIAPKLGININYCCPPSREPNEIILARSLERLDQQTGKITSFSTPQEAVKDANAVYTDVWTSMGFENQVQENVFSGFQVNEHLMRHANPQAVFMHCMPMVRGKEVSNTLPDRECSVIFQQSENRLHIQKALLLFLIKGELS